MRKRVKAQITVYAAISIFLVFTLVCTCIGSAAVSAKQAHVEAAAALSMESVFAGYSNKLLEKFDIFALQKTEELQSDFEEYIKKNIETGTSGGIEVLSAKLDNYIMMTDNGGECIYRQVLSYMKYAAYSEIAAQLSGIKDKQEKAEAVKEITESIIDCEALLCEQEEHILGIIQKVDGIKVDNSGIVIHNGKTVCTDSYFVKAALSKPLSMENLGVTVSAVYDGVKDNGRFIDVVQLVCDLEENAEEYQRDNIEDYDESYRSNRQKLEQILLQVLEITKTALDDLTKYENTSKSVAIKIEQCKEQADNKKEMLGEDTYQTFVQDITDMQKQQKEHRTSLCDTERIKKALEQRKLVISTAYNFVSQLEETLYRQQYEKVRDKLGELKEILQQIDNNDLVFDYSHVDFSEKKSGINKIKEIYDSMTDGVCGLVLEKDKISSKEISYADLADQNIAYGSGVEIKSDIKEAIYNEYVFMKFDSYTDYLQENSGQESGKLLDYMVEYILYGENSDKKNISRCITELALLREGMNMAYLITDSSKRKEAEMLAASLVGFTGNIAVVKAAKYMIMGAWAFGESILELRQLYKGEKVEFIKTKENWKLSLDKLLNMDFSQSDYSKETDKGLLYEEYLRVLLLLGNPVKKYYRTMSAMELHMMELGFADFRMRNYIYAAEGDILYRISPLKYCSEKKGYYSYG